MDQSNANLEKEISQVRNDIATNIDDVKAIWKETEKTYSADKQEYQNQIRDNRFGYYQAVAYAFRFKNNE